MERFNISIIKDTETLNFEVADYPVHEEDHCKFEIYIDGNFVAGLEPDKNKHLTICKNPGQLDDTILHLIADEIETYHF